MNTPAVRILSVQSCPTISGKSKLTYHLGVADSEIQIRLYANSGGGFFSKEWISLKAILRTVPANLAFHVPGTARDIPWQVLELSRLLIGGPETRRTGDSLQGEA